MQYIKGFTFGFMTEQGKFADEQSKQSLRLMEEKTESNTVIFALGALQKTAHSEDVDYTGSHMPSDDELIEMIHYAKGLGLRVILKPLVNCKDGTWRAHINFFDKEVICEPKWSNWFKSYTQYQLHYAHIAQSTECEMLIVGCEMVQTERRADEWRKLIQDVKKVYTGLVSYNTDKYQEDNVTWWDAVDVISSSGYYPINDWDNQIARIEKVVKKYNKPFFFAEAGCPSREGAANIPNDWEHVGGLDLKEQANYYQVMFDTCTKIDWIRGFGLWDWKSHIYEEKDGMYDDEYAVYGKPACNIIKDFYKLKIT